jgi:hypothetical protein
LHLVAAHPDHESVEKFAAGIPIGSYICIFAMLLSDAGLSSAEPKWFNASPRACVLIGMQPRGARQVFQRSVQWGHSKFTNVFGVDCRAPRLYEYFSCIIRNRLEVWNSKSFQSPMKNQQQSASWNSTLHRPTKLVAGSRGGRAYICKLLAPAEGQHYGIEQQAHAQLLSVLLAAASMINENQDFGTVLEDDFGVSEKLSVIFSPLLLRLLEASILAGFLGLSVLYSHLAHNYFGRVLPYAVEASSMLFWVIGAVGLLAIGGHPRVRIVRKPIPLHVESRLPSGKVPEEMRLEFGSLDGSDYTNDRGTTILSSQLVRDICQYDLELRRPADWWAYFGWFTTMVLMSVGLKVVGITSATFGSQLIGVGFLIVTSIWRGAGIHSPESWLIPDAQRRPKTNYGAILVGQVDP